MSEDVISKLGFLLFTMTVVALFIGANQRDKMKQEAVERGYAEWVVDSKGETKWRWKEVRHE